MISICLFLVPQPKRCFVLGCGCAWLALSVSRWEEDHGSDASAYFVKTYTPSFCFWNPYDNRFVPREKRMTFSLIFCQNPATPVKLRASFVLFARKSLAVMKVLTNVRNPVADKGNPFCFSVISPTAHKTFGRFCCPACGMHHLAWCDATQQPQDADSALKERPCLQCPAGQPPAKKRKTDPPSLPRDENAEMETSM